MYRDLRRLILQSSSRLNFSHLKLLSNNHIINSTSPDCSKLTLIQAGIKDNEEIEISNFKNSSEDSDVTTTTENKDEELPIEQFLINTSPWVLRLICADIDLPDNPKQLLMMATHAMLLEAGFICVAERESANKVHINLNLSALYITSPFFLYLCCY